MAPLVPEIISSEFNFIIALLVGIGFGFALEQAGFSSTKKLVGLFYGYDFTVLKVFFTAGVTAMIGTLVLGHLGILNLSLIYINPTFVPSALVGGFIMGAGFIVGGFCPGTSVCAAAVGKLDGLAFIGGSFLGIFAFMEFYPALEGLYKANPMGGVLIFNQLGMSRTLWALTLTIVAIGAFYGVTLIENGINKRQTVYAKPLVVRYSAAGILAVLLIGFVFITPNAEEKMMANIEQSMQDENAKVEMISADKLASEMMDEYYNYVLIDIRSAQDYTTSHIPLAKNVPLDSIQNPEFKHYFTQKHQKIVFYSDDAETAKRAYFTSQHLGKAHCLVLNETEKEFNQLFALDATNTANTTKEIQQFRQAAAKKLYDLQEALKHQSAPVKKKAAKVQGGCS